MRRSVAVGAASAVAVAAAAGGWLAGRGIQSPDQAALEAEPPSASLITVEVELAELAADVISRADVGYDEPVPLSLSGALGDREAALVVTSAPERGARLQEGDVAIEIAGRPVFLLTGAVPVYRDLRPQDRGPDVAQLEEALARLGHFDEEPDRLWDRATSEAVEAWYEAAGYGANGSSEAERNALRAARDRRDAARDALAAAERSLAEARRGPTEVEVRRARTAVLAAESALQKARLAADEAQGAPPSQDDAVRAVEDAESAVAAADRAVEDAESAVAAADRAVVDAGLAVAAEDRAVEDAELAVAAADRAVEDAARDRESARQAVEEARWAVGGTSGAREQAAHRLTEAQLRWESAQAGVHPDTGAVPSPSEHEALRLAARAAERSLGDAERAVAAAQRDVTDAERAAEDADHSVADARRAADRAVLGVANARRAADRAVLGVADARRAAARARADAEAARRAAARARTDAERRRAEVPGEAERSQAIEDAELSLRQAADGLAAAEESLAELLAPPDTEDLSDRLERARADIADAEASLENLEAAAGVWLPAGELIVLRRLPVRVDLITGERGRVVSGSFMTVTGSELAVRGSVSERDVERVSGGAAAYIDDRSLAEPVPGTIRLVDARAGTRGVAPDRHYVEIVADGIPEDLVGRNVKIVIPVGGTDGAVLVVPVAALSATADGSTRVEVEQADGSTRFVSVAPGLSTGGRVEVTPLDGELAVGDRVVVGQAAGE